MNNADYAVRISKASKGGVSGGIGVNISFGPKCRIPDEFNAVEVSFFPNKLLFRFFKTLTTRFSNKKMSNTKKMSVLKNGYCFRASSSDAIFMEKINDYLGEYDELMSNPQYQLSDKMKNEYNCWINLSAKSGYSNLYKNSSTVITPKKHELPELEIKTDICLEKPKVTTEVIKQVIDKQYEDLEANDAPEKTIVPIRVEELERVLCEDVLKEAHECTRRMQEKISNLLEYRLKRRDLDPGEADGNLDFCKVITKYARLEYGVGDLIRNVRHTWSDGRDLYERYKELLKEEPDISDEEAAKKLDVKVEEFQETIEAVERILEDTKDSFKPGFAIE